MTGNSPEEVKIELKYGVSLIFRHFGSGPWDYPSCRIQKGLILTCGEKDLAEEGVGFGVPVLKFGHETVFPGSARVITRKNRAASTVEVSYDLNMVQRLSVKGKTISSRAIYRVQDYFSRMHRNCPPLRSPGMWFFSNLLRIFAIEQKFENTSCAGTVSIVYSIPGGEGRVQVSVDFTGLRKDGCTAITIANEQGASYFDRYRDSNGLVLAGKAIGTWDEAFAEEAALTDMRDGVTFTLRNLKGTRMFRGREVAAGRLAWSGLNYVLPQDTDNFAYDIKIGAAE